MREHGGADRLLEERPGDGAESATRAAVSRALARSSTGRASSNPAYFCMLTRSAGRGGRVSGALRATPLSSSGWTGVGGQTVSHLGHCRCPPRWPPGLMVAVPHRPRMRTPVLLELMRAAPYAEASAGQVAIDVGRRRRHGRGDLEIATRAGPCDFAVSQRNMAPIFHTGAA